MLPETTLSLEQFLIMGDDQHCRKTMCESYSCLRQQRMQEIMGEIKLNRSLDLRELRKEQRRVAALLGHQSHIKPSGALYKSPRGGHDFHHCICSKLHPNLQCPHPSHNFLQQGLANVREARQKARNAKQGKGLKRRYSVDSADLQRQRLRGIKGRSLTPFNRSPSVIKGTLQYKDSVRAKDIRDFDYKQLREDIINNELGEDVALPDIYQNSLTQQGQVVPKNTPESSLILLKKSKKGKMGKQNHPIAQGTAKGSKHNNGSKKQVVFNQTVRETKGKADTLRYTHSHVGDGNAMDYCTCGELAEQYIEADVDDIPGEADSVESFTSGYFTDSPKSGDRKQMSPRKDQGNGHNNGKSVPRHIHSHNSVVYKQQRTVTLDSREGGRWCSNCGKCKVPKVETFSSRDNGKQSRTQAQGYKSSGLPGGGYSLSREHSRALSMNSISSGSLTRLHEEYGDKFEDELRHRSPDYIGGPRDGRLSSFSDYSTRKNDSGLAGESDEANTEDDQYGAHNMQFYRQGVNGLSKMELYPDGYQEAYDKALAAAQISKLPLEPWMLGNRISKPYQFSYFMPNPYPGECEACSKPVKRSAKAEHLPKKVKPMKHVFGSLDMNDFYPGGKRNPLYLRK